MIQQGKIKQFVETYRSFIPYLVFGILTTLVNIATYWVCAHVLMIGTMQSTIVAWVLAVLFAYITNRKWVFHSSTNGVHAIVKEIAMFYACRITTGIVDWACMYVFVDLLSYNDVVIKFFANVLVIILNYVASRLFIFQKHSR